jgi:hypothetical protein
VPIGNVTAEHAIPTLPTSPATVPRSWIRVLATPSSSVSVGSEVLSSVSRSGGSSLRGASFAAAPVERHVGGAGDSFGTPLLR